MKILVCLPLFFILLVSDSYASAPKVTLVFKKGKVRVVREGKKIKAQKGAKLTVRDEIITGKSGLAIVQIEDKNARQTLKIEKGSRLSLEVVSSDLHQTRLKRGGVFVYLKSKIKNKKKNPKVKLISRSASMGVRGTEFFASYGPEGHRDDFWMCVNEGKVQVVGHKSKDSVIVNEGEGIQISDEQKLEKPKVYEWTKKLNWNSNPNKGSIENKISLDDHYNDLLDQDYD